MAAAAAAMVLVSCEKDRAPYTSEGKTPLATPANINVNADYKQATITWDAVPGAAQYYYEIRNASNFVSSKGFITSNSFYLSGLKQLTDYSFYLKAIPSADDASTTAGSEMVIVPFKTEDASAYLWEARGKVFVGGNDTGRTATIQYEYATGVYTLLGWYGYAGYDMVFNVNEAGNNWVWDETKSPCFYWADTPNNAYSFYDGGNGAGYTWLYTTNTAFSGGKDGGRISCWGWIENANWAEWAVEW